VFSMDRLLCVGDRFRIIKVPEGLVLIGSLNKKKIIPPIEFDRLTFEKVDYSADCSRIANQNYLSEIWTTTCAKFNDKDEYYIHSLGCLGTIVLSFLQVSNNVHIPANCLELVS